MTANNTTPSTGNEETGVESQTYREIAERSRGEQLRRKQQAVDQAAIKLFSQLTRDDTEPMTAESLRELHTELVDLLHFVEGDVAPLIPAEVRPKRTLAYDGVESPEQRP
jgi:hypothetical protein